MFPYNWTHLYNSEYVKSVRHVRTSSRILTLSAYTAVLATVITTFWNQKPLFYCYFPFETRYAHNVQGYICKLQKFLYSFVDSLVLRNSIAMLHGIHLGQPVLLLKIYQLNTLCI